MYVIVNYHHNFNVTIIIDLKCIAGNRTYIANCYRLTLRLRGVGQNTNYYYPEGGSAVKQVPGPSQL